MTILCSFSSSFFVRCLSASNERIDRLCNMLDVCVLMDGNCRQLPTFLELAMCSESAR